MPGPVPGIHIVIDAKKGVDGRVKPGHDGMHASPRSLSSGAHSRDPLAPRNDERHQIWRSTIISLSSAMASEGLRLFGQALAQFMMVWQR